MLRKVFGLENEISNTVIDTDQLCPSIVKVVMG